MSLPKITPGLPLTTPTSTETFESELHALVHASWTDPPEIRTSNRIGAGRGVFSRVHALELDWEKVPGSPSATTRPNTVVAKLPAVGPNRQAAIASGAYEREALAYCQLLNTSPIGVPAIYGIHRHLDGAIGFLLQDLRSARFVNQVVGLDALDSVTTVEQLGRWHHPKAVQDRVVAAKAKRLRRSTPSLLGLSGLHAGLRTLATTWEDDVSSEDHRSFERLVQNRALLIEAFDSAPVSLCHGDVRADNLAFDHALDTPGGSPLVLFDWQQISLQMAEADLSWLLATSLSPTLRRETEHQLVNWFADASGRDFQVSWDRYRAGLVLPGLAVLFLAQRELSSPEAYDFVRVSLQRIAAALVDHQLA